LSAELSLEKTKDHETSIGTYPIVANSSGHSLWVLLPFFGMCSPRSSVKKLSAALSKVNQYVQGSMQWAHLVLAKSPATSPAKNCFTMDFRGPALEFQAPLWPIARSAAELLISNNGDADVVWRGLTQRIGVDFH